MCTVSGVRGRGEVEETVMAIRGAGGGYKVHTGRGLVVGVAQAEGKIQVVGGTQGISSLVR